MVGMLKRFYKEQRMINSMPLMYYQKKGDFLNESYFALSSPTNKNFCLTQNHIQLLQVFKWIYEGNRFLKKINKNNNVDPNLTKFHLE